MRIGTATAIMLLFAGSSSAGCQKALAPSAPATSASSSRFDLRSGEEIQRQGAAYLEQARQRPDGLMSVTLEQYSNHLTMLAARTKSGGAELHRHVSDFFIVVEGEATEVVGGTVENATEASPGEVRGSRVVGGTEHHMRAGDVIHILANTPHQALLAPGGHIVYYVIKVTEPEGK